MAADAFIQCRVSHAAKAALRASAQRQNLTESALLLRLLATAFQVDAGPAAARVEGARKVPRDSRLYVRLKPDDRLLLAERAVARHLPAATYVSMLLRTHLRGLPPLPHEELRALRRSVAALDAVGRHLNQIARSASQGVRPVGPSREHVATMLKISQALRDHVTALIEANCTSWATGYPHERV